MNVDLLSKTLDHIETLDAFEREGVKLNDAWNQDVWFEPTRDEAENICGTQACFAGWACVLAGDRLVEEKVVEQWGTGDHVYDYEHTEAFAYDPDGNRHEVDERARELLGISPQRAKWLFSWENDLDTLRKRVRRALKAAEV